MIAVAIAIAIAIAIMTVLMVVDSTERDCRGRVLRVSVLVMLGIWIGIGMAAISAWLGRVVLFLFCNWYCSDA